MIVAARTRRSDCHEASGAAWYKTRSPIRELENTSAFRYLGRANVEMIIKSHCSHVTYIIIINIITIQLLYNV